MRWHITGDETLSEKTQKGLVALGDDVSARWLKFDYEGEDEEALATMDDIAKSQGLVYCIGDEWSSGNSDTALGMAISFNKRTVVVGNRQTIYHHLPTIEHYPTLAAFIKARKEENNAAD